MQTIEWNDFAKVELRVGRIVRASIFPEVSKPAYILQVDFGPEIGVKKSTAQITHVYQVDDLVGKQVVAAVHLPKKQVGPVMSECLITGFHDGYNEVVLCVPDRPVPLGTKLL